MSKKNKDKEMYDLMISEFNNFNKISKIKEEEYVLRSIIHGVPRATIVKELNKRHSEENITTTDLVNFLSLNQDVLELEKNNIQKNYIRQLARTKTGLTNELHDLAIMAKQMMVKYDAAGDNSNAVSALKTAADIFMKFGKVEGLTIDQPEVNINMQMDRVVQNISKGNNELSDNLKKIIDVDVDVDVEE
ncbi:MAG: hypothetical protein B7C24_13690 [Bacteroidetes bacterium 4572_77]|nr:MAG: hypothetical protein B7C24_13690 [Bacteroidetes bacterium 4572_77]